MSTVSVIIPAHNLASSLGEAIESALAQTHKDLEIVVVDDGSTDDTEKVVSQYRTRIIYMQQERKGVAAARNRGIKISGGEYVAFLDADDLWLPEKLEEQVPYLHQSPETGLVCSDWSLISDQGSVEPSVLTNRNHVGSGYVFRQIVESSFILTSTVIARRSCLEEAGLFDESFPTAEDLDLWLRISYRHNVALVRKPLVIKRSRPEGLSADPRLAATFRIKLFQKALMSFPDLSVSDAHLIRSILSKNYFDLGYADFVGALRRQARRNFLCSLRHDWTNGRALRCLAASYLPALVVRVARTLKRAVLE